MNELVSLKYLDNYKGSNVEDVIKQSFSLLNVNQVIKPKKTVLIKVHLPGAVSPDSGYCTNPKIVQGLVSVLNSMGVKCIIADYPDNKTGIANVEKVYQTTGMLDVANSTQCTLNTNLSYCTLPVADGIKTKSVDVLDLINHVDGIINVGKIAVDDKLGYKGVAYNLFGLVPGEIRNLVLNRMLTYKDFNNYMIDLYSALKDKILLNVVDGVVALEAGNTQRMLSFIGMSYNAFSLDAAVQTIINVRYDNAILHQAKDRGYFRYAHAYRWVGEHIDKFKIKDFCLLDFDNDTLIHKNEKVRLKAYNKLQAKPTINCKECKGCSVCSKICPTGAISMKLDKAGELYADIDYNKCILCYKCQLGCPYQVVKINKPLANKKIEYQLNKNNVT